MSPLHLVIYFHILVNIDCIWPPVFKVNWKYNEEFVISELLQKSDVEDVYDEEEMISEEQVKSVNADKYYRLHRQVMESNQKAKNSLSADRVAKNAANLSDIIPRGESISENVDKNNLLYHGYEDLYFDDEAKSNKTDSQYLEKRSTNNTAKLNYDYDSLKAQYEDNVNRAEKKNDTVKYQEVKEEESAAEAAKSMVTFERRNCTIEETQGFGLAALECFWIEIRNKSPNKNKQTYLLKKILLILLIWATVYILIALPLWCQYGWCCCCCRCKFCRPRDQIEEIKTFFFNNPPGVYYDEKGNLIKYQSTIYELYAQKGLQKAIQRL